MDTALALIFYWAIAGMCVVVGVALGYTLHGNDILRTLKKNCSGDIVIAQGDEDAERYMFLDLNEEPEALEENEFIVLHVKNVGTREKHPA